MERARACAPEVMRIITTGLIAQHPLGGVTWDYIQYILGLVRLGHDAYYIEDSGSWPYALDGGPGGDDFNVADCSANVRYLADVMKAFDLGDRWAYRCPIDGDWFGLSSARRRDVIESADLLLNVSSTVLRPEEYRSARRMAFIDSDPVFTQIKLARGQHDFRAVVDAHDVHFSFGESFSARVPETGHEWLPTRQPIVLSEWPRAETRRDVFTTVMNWASYNPVSFNGDTYGQKDTEFMRFLDLPRHVAPEVLEIAARGTSRRELPEALVGHLKHKGWRLVDPSVVCPDVNSYRTHIQTSKGEWSVAKNGYVTGSAGWFSCRSACYLAAGRPVVVQDTGFSRVLPTGAGLVTFDTLEEAAAGIRAVSADYDRQSAAARAIAAEYFDSSKVLADLIETAMTHSPRELSREVSG